MARKYVTIRELEELMLSLKLGFPNESDIEKIIDIQNNIQSSFNIPKTRNYYDNYIKKFCLNYKKRILGYSFMIEKRLIKPFCDCFGIDPPQEISKSSQNEDIQKEDIKNEYFQNKNTQNEDIQKENTQNEDIQKENTQNEDIQNKNTQNEIIQKENTQNEDIQKETTQNEYFQNKNTQNEDIQKETTQNEYFQNHESPPQENETPKKNIDLENIIALKPNPEGKKIPEEDGEIIESIKKKFSGHTDFVELKDINTPVDLKKKIKKNGLKEPFLSFTNDFLDCLKVPKKKRYFFEIIYCFVENDIDSHQIDELEEKMKLLHISGEINKQRKKNPKDSSEMKFKDPSNLEALLLLNVKEGTIFAKVRKGTISFQNNKINENDATFIIYILKLLLLKNYDTLKTSKGNLKRIKKFYDILCYAIEKNSYLKNNKVISKFSYENKDAENIVNFFFESSPNTPPNSISSFVKNFKFEQKDLVYMEILIQYILEKKTLIGDFTKDLNENLKFFEENGKKLPETKESLELIDVIIKLYKPNGPISDFKNEYLAKILYNFIINLKNNEILKEKEFESVFGRIILFISFFSKEVFDKNFFNKFDDAKSETSKLYLLLSFLENKIKYEKNKMAKFEKRRKLSVKNIFSDIFSFFNEPEEFFNKLHFLRDYTNYDLMRQLRKFKDEFKDTKKYIQIDVDGPEKARRELQKNYYPLYFLNSKFLEKSLNIKGVDIENKYSLVGIIYNTYYEKIGEQISGLICLNYSYCQWIDIKERKYFYNNVTNLTEDANGKFYYLYRKKDEKIIKKIKKLKEHRFEKIEKELTPFILKLNEDIPYFFLKYHEPFDNFFSELDDKTFKDLKNRLKNRECYYYIKNAFAESNSLQERYKFKEKFNENLVW